MSTLTKVLIVLLTVFSIFLCGIVVTYVANAENQRAKAEGLQSRVQAAERREEAAQEELQNEQDRARNEKARLEEQIAALGAQIKNLDAELDAATRARDQWAQKAAGMAAAVETANAASKQQTTLFETAQQEVQNLRAEQTNRRKELDETNQMLLERMAVISQLEEKVRRLTEENQEVEARLNQYLQQYGRIAAKPPTTVAPRNTSVLPMQPATATPALPTRTIDLNGQVTAVDMKSKLAEVSIGAAAGVRQEMKFHITRGDRWVADLLILEVWPDKAVGIVDLVQQGMEPKAGDKIATNL